MQSRAPDAARAVEAEEEARCLASFLFDGEMAVQGQRLAGGQR